MNIRRIWAQLAVVAVVLTGLALFPSVALAHGGHDHVSVSVSSQSVDSRTSDAQPAQLKTFVRSAITALQSANHVACAGGCCSGAPCSGCIGFIPASDVSVTLPSSNVMRLSVRHSSFRPGWDPEGLRKPPRPFA
jgi:hypothetical protein